MPYVGGFKGEFGDWAPGTDFDAHPNRIGKLGSLNLSVVAVLSCFIWVGRVSDNPCQVLFQ